MTSTGQDTHRPFCHPDNHFFGLSTLQLRNDEAYYNYNTMQQIAFFVSSHGFGHATRAAAVMAAIHNLDPDTHFQVFTLAPEWLFQVSLSCPFTYHPRLTDVGMVQKSAFEEDVEATVQQLSTFLPFQRDMVNTLAAQVNAQRCQLVICDIAPLGIVVARAAGVPSVLIENFTWDWIYAAYLDLDSRFQPHIQYLADIFQLADFHIQTEPVCSPSDSADLVTVPVGRSPRLPAGSVRDKLHIPEAAKMVLVTMGINQLPSGLMGKFAEIEDVCFVLPQVAGNFSVSTPSLRTPSLTKIYHPDLVHASDALIGKAGYSTLAEAYIARTPYIYLPRDRFRESTKLAEFTETHMTGFPILKEEFATGNWLPRLRHLMEIPRQKPPKNNGAEQAARFLLKLL